MKRTVAALCGATLLCANAAQAVEITGGSVELSYSSFASESSVRQIGIEGSMEIGFTQNFSAQVDLTHHKFNTSGEDITTIATHVIYHMNDVTSFGAFYAIEDTAKGEFDYYGIEAGHEIGLFEFEGYIGRADAKAVDADVAGISARYGFADTFGVTGSYDYIDLTGSDLSTATLRIDRDVSDNVNLFVEVGSARANAGGLSGSEGFVGLGGKYTFGAERGATFNTRGIATLLPGG